MGVRDEVKDPWTYVVSGLGGGFAWAILAPVTAAAPPLGVAVGAAVFAAKVLTGAFTRSGRRRAAQRDRRLPVLTRTSEAAWLGRAKEAQETFEEIAASAREGPIADEVRSFGEQTHESLLALERLAGQASTVRTAMARLDVKRLAWERDRLVDGARPGEDPRLVAERGRALAAVESQLDAHRRLNATLEMLLARLQSGTLGIEGLVARLAEVVALAETSTVTGEGHTQVDELAHELEGLRAGLAEAESVSTRAMEGLPPLSSQAPGSVAPDDTPARRRAGGE